jgi:hypothetical protein
MTELISEFISKSIDLQINNNFIKTNPNNNIFTLSYTYSKIYRNAPICGESFFNSMENSNNICKKLNISLYDPNTLLLLLQLATNIINTDLILINDSKYPPLFNIITNYLFIK